MSSSTYSTYETRYSTRSTGSEYFSAGTKLYARYPPARTTSGGRIYIECSKTPPTGGYRVILYVPEDDLKLLFTSSGGSEQSSPKPLEIPCTKCAKTFITRAELDYHLQTVHFETRSNGSGSSSSAWMPCPICNKEFYGVTSLESHIAYNHPDTPKSSGSPAPRAAPAPAPAAVEHKCKYCGRVEAGPMTLKQHVELYHPTRADYTPTPMSTTTTSNYSSSYSSYYKTTNYVVEMDFTEVNKSNLEIPLRRGEKVSSYYSSGSRDGWVWVRNEKYESGYVPEFCLRQVSESGAAMEIDDPIGSRHFQHERYGPRPGAPPLPPPPPVTRPPGAGGPSDEIDEATLAAIRAAQGDEGPPPPAMSPPPYSPEDPYARPAAGAPVAGDVPPAPAPAPAPVPPVTEAGPVPVDAEGRSPPVRPPRTEVPPPGPHENGTTGPPPTEASPAAAPAPAGDAPATPAPAPAPAADAAPAAAPAAADRGKGEASVVDDEIAAQVAAVDAAVAQAESEAAATGKAPAAPAPAPAPTDEVNEFEVCPVTRLPRKDLLAPDGAAQGSWRGIQGWNNSCYIDALLTSMFAFNTTLDDLIAPTEAVTPRSLSGSVDDAEREKDRRNILRLRTSLRKDIVGGLRRRLFVSYETMRLWRLILNELWWPNNDALQGPCEEQDVLDLLNRLCELLSPHGRQLLSYVHDEEETGRDLKEVSSEYYTLAPVPELAKDSMPTTQMLLDAAVSKRRFVFRAMPPVLALHMPREYHGSVYERIIPSLYLTVQVAEPGVGEDGKTTVGEALPHEMELFAILAIGESHYVTYLRADNDADEAQWLYFDSMGNVSKLEGSVPELKPCPLGRELSDPDSLRKTVEYELKHKTGVKKYRYQDMGRVHLHTKRVLEDVYVCFYRPSTRRAPAAEGGEPPTPPSGPPPSSATTYSRYERDYDPYNRDPYAPSTGSAGYTAYDAYYGGYGSTAYSVGGRNFY